MDVFECVHIYLQSHSHTNKHIKSVYTVQPLLFNSFPYIHFPSLAFVYLTCYTSAQFRLHLDYIYTVGDELLKSLRVFFLASLFMKSGWTEKSQ